jgi:hypothetical protein
MWHDVACAAGAGIDASVNNEEGHSHDSYQRGETVFIGKGITALSFTVGALNGSPVGRWSVGAIGGFVCE